MSTPIYNVIAGASDLRSHTRESLLFRFAGARFIASAFGGQTDHLGKAKSPSLAHSRDQVLLPNWLGVGRSCKLNRRRYEQGVEIRKRELKEQSDVR
jgi:hypothetical protein